MPATEVGGTAHCPARRHEGRLARAINAVGGGSSLFICGGVVAGRWQRREKSYPCRPASLTPEDPVCAPAAAKLAAAATEGEDGEGIARRAWVGCLFSARLPAWGKKRRGGRGQAGERV